MARLEKKGLFKDGFYIEVHNPGETQPVYIHRETEPEILQALQNYRIGKLVKYLGEARDGRLPANTMR